MEGGGIENSLGRFGALSCGVFLFGGNPRIKKRQDGVLPE
jgi:hypothetical protein